MEIEQRFCKDCKHAKYQRQCWGVMKTWWCLSLHSGRDAVTGEYKFETCEHNRRRDCGHEARWFEPKGPPTVMALKADSFNPVEIPAP